VAVFVTVRTGERFATLAGAVAVLVSMVLFATLDPSSGLGIVLVALALSGIGMGVALPATSAAMANEVAAEEYGVMSAAQLLASQVGEVAGIQVALTLQESLSRHAGLGNVGRGSALLHSFQVAFWVAALVAGIGVVCAAFIRPMAGDGRSPR
jgi:MFS family permease